MPFALICVDKPGHLDLRLATRPAHLAHLESCGITITEAGPMLDLAGKPCGSILIIDAPDRAAAERFAAEDPYAKAGLFESVQIRGYAHVYRGGERAA